MGLFDMFGAGGGSLSIQPVSPHVAPGQALVGNVVFTGGTRAQQINALTIRLTQETRTMQMTNNGPQPRTDSREIVPATPLTQPFQTTPGQPVSLPFQLQLPPGLPSSTPQQVTYHLRTTADIPGEIDPGASLEIQVVGGTQPQMGMPGMQPGMMQPGMMQPGMMQPGMMQPGMMQPGMMQPGMMQPGMMQPGMMQPGMMQPGMMQPGMMQPGMMQPGMMQPGMMQPGMGQLQIANGTRVHAQWHGDGQLHPGTVRGFDNGMYNIDWVEPHLGASSYVYPQQIQVPAAGAGHAPMGAPMHGKPDMHAKGGHDPYAKGQDMHGKGMDAKGGGHDMHGKAGGKGQITMGERVMAQHPSGQWYPGRVAAMQNGMIGVDWDDPKLGASSWVQPHQVRD